MRANIGLNDGGGFKIRGGAGGIIFGKVLARLNDASAMNRIGIGGCLLLSFGSLNSFAHLVDDGGTTFGFFLSEDIAGAEIISAFEHIGSVHSFGIEVIFHGGIGVFNGVTFGID